MWIHLYADELTSKKESSEEDEEKEKEDTETSDDEKFSSRELVLMIFEEKIKYMKPNEKETIAKIIKHL